MGRLVKPTAWAQGSVLVFKYGEPPVTEVSNRRKPVVASGFAAVSDDQQRGSRVLKTGEPLWGAS
ncbi:hypothetical protein GCM10022247_45000 [Allokutzneria multivorans]|uniref:Uncharacterized protein n=1 Tax=Allokutzneria multivorans TaxID=1142134 RepID=A0ABP7SVY6_9PSEU